MCNIYLGGKGKTIDKLVYEIKTLIEKNSFFITRLPRLGSLR